MQELEKDLSLKNNSSTSLDAKPFLPIVFDIHGSQLGLNEPFTQNGVAFMSSEKAFFESAPGTTQHLTSVANSANSISPSNLGSVLAYSSEGRAVPLTNDGTAEFVYDKAATNAPILLAANYFASSSGPSASAATSVNTGTTANYADHPVTLKETFSNIAFVISSGNNQSELNSSNLLLTSSGFNASSPSYSDANSGKPMSQQQQQKLKMPKSKKTHQMSSEIDEERTSQLVSEILKNIKEKTKELENLNQNLKTTSHTDVAMAASCNSSQTPKSVTNPSKTSLGAASFSSIASDVSNSSYMSHECDEVAATRSQKTECTGKI